MLVHFCIVDVWMISEFHSRVENEIIGIFLTAYVTNELCLFWGGVEWGGLVVLFDSGV